MKLDKLDAYLNNLQPSLRNIDKANLSYMFYDAYM